MAHILPYPSECNAQANVADAGEVKESPMSQPMTQTLVVHQMRAENCFVYLLADVDAREAALVDPRVDRVMEYLADLEEGGLRWRAS